LKPGLTADKAFAGKLSGNRRLQVVLLAAAVFAVQVFTALSGTDYYLTQLTMSAYYILVIMGLCTLMGYAGQISLGHAGFFAMGGYLSALMTTHNLIGYKGTAVISALSSAGLIVARQGLYGDEIMHIHPWASAITAVLTTIIVAYLIGGPVLKLKGHYLAMATLAFGTIIYTIVVGSDIFGAADGISDVPGFKILPGLEVSGGRSVRVSNYYIAWGLVLLGVLMLLNLMDSRVGRALRSIHGAEDAASATGVDTDGYKLKIFVLSAAMAAVAGVFLTHFNGGIGPSESSVMKSIRYVAIVAVGGMANLWGALVMGVVLNFLSLRGVFGSFDEAIFGGILIVIMLFAPDGILKVDLPGIIREKFFSSGEEG